MSNDCRQQPSGDGHTAPCPWSKSLMVIASILLTVGGFTLGTINGRVGMVEKQVGDMRENLAAMRASLDYVQRDLADIKATLRRDEVRKGAP